MACMSPLRAWRPRRATEAGTRPLAFLFKDGYEDREVLLPCGQCLHCRMEKKLEWACRATHEAHMHERNSFVTLTYAETPLFGSLRREDFTKFVHTLRKQDFRFRYFACGEYGPKTLRPHYHALLFGFEPDDCYPWRKSPSGHTLYRSPHLEQVWQHGHVEVGPVNEQTASYVAGYVVKKKAGKAVEKLDEETGLRLYERLDPFTGELYTVEPEFHLMSLKPGLGATFYEKYRSDIDRDDFVLFRGKRMRIPRYYEKLRERADEKLAARLRGKRKRVAKPLPDAARRRGKQDFLRAVVETNERENIE